MEQGERRFLADSMLGKLAKWLRVMGYDTHYQPFYQTGVIGDLIRERRILLTRNTSLTFKQVDSVLIQPDNVKDQLEQMRTGGYLKTDRSKWFSRCLVCNIRLNNIPADEAAANIPEYILHQHNPTISYCPACRRYFWPGSHSLRMFNQLKEWGFNDE